MTLGLLRKLLRAGTVQLVMKALAGLLCVLLAGCAAPQLSSPSPSPSVSITFDCSPKYFACSDISEAGILTAVANLGYPVKAITIGFVAKECGVWQPPDTAPPCQHPNAAYVSFVGTDKIAEIVLGDTSDASGVYYILDFAANDSSPAP